MLEDNESHRGLRNRLIEQLRTKGIVDDLVLNAMAKVPRHLFMDSTFLKFAYADQAFPIASGQTISQPYTVAVQTSLLEVSPHLKILEIGTGSGYQAAVLATMGARVYSIERIHHLHQTSKSLLSQMAISVRLFYGDGYAGLPAFAPFDRILITAAIPELPHELTRQLRRGGVLVMPEGDQGSQVMKKIIRTHEDEFVTSTHGSFIFVPMIKGTE